MKIIWQTVRRITNEILGVEGLSDQSRKVGGQFKKAMGTLLRVTTRTYPFTC